MNKHTKKNNNPLDSYKIIKELGHGGYGTVYKVVKNNEYYAMKIEHVYKDNIKKSLKSPIWKEINFANYFGKKYPDQFMKLIDYDFITNCKYKQKPPAHIEILKSGTLKNKYIKLYKSPYCSRKVYTLVDTTLKDIKLKLNLKQLYSMLIQLAYIIYLIHSHHYVHKDFADHNIGVIKTNKKYVTIFGHKVPLYGYQYQAIDYGTVDSFKNILNVKQKDFFDRKKIKEQMIYTKVLHNEDYWTFVENNFIVLLDKNEYYAKLLSHPNMNQIKNISSDPNILIHLFELEYPELSQKIRYGDQDIKFIPPKLLIPKNDIRFLIINYKDLKTQALYLMDKLKELEQKK